MLTEALGFPARTLYERIDRRHVERLLEAPPEQACGYSRDLWRDETEERS